MNPPHAPRRAEPLRLGAMILLGLAMVAVVAVTIVTRGPFAWHFTQTEAWHGGLEAAVLYLAVFAGLQATRASFALRLAIIGLPVALYLRRHHVDGVLLACLAYVEGLFALGALAVRRLRRDAESPWLESFLVGVALMSLGLWIAQAAGFGTPRAQRLLAFVMLVPALLFHRRLQIASLVASAWQQPTSGRRAWVAWLIVFPLVLLARSNVVTDFDSAWYGLRPDRVLVGVASVFEPLGLSSPVYYFPKLYEVLVLPLAASREDSVVLGFSIACTGLLARLVFDFLRRLQVGASLALAGTAALWTLPAVGSVALGAKPDALAALLVLAMAWFTLDIAQGRHSRFAWVFGCAALAASSKIVAIPYAGIAGIAALVVLFTTRRAPDDRDRTGIAFATCCVIVALFCLARTLLVAGMPTIGPEHIVRVWEALGMTRPEPVGMLEWANPQVWSDLPSIAIGWIADPSRFSHLQISWAGNLYLFLPLAALILGRATLPAEGPRWPLWAVPLAGLVMLITIGFTNPGGDGNYFIAPVLLACVAGLAMLARRIDTAARLRAITVVLVACTAFHFAYGFVSAGWIVGTPRWTADFSRPNRESPARKGDELSHLKLDGVVRVLHGAGGRMRVSGAVPWNVAFNLPARYEDLFDIYLSHMVDGKTTQLLRLASCGGVEAMLLPLPSVDEIPQREIRKAVGDLTALPAARDLYRDDHWRLIDVRGALPPCNALTATEIDGG